MRDLDAYYILEGKKVLKVGRDTCDRWQSQKPEAKIVAQEDVGSFWVSTVFLVHDHNWSNEGPPIVFETMVFGREADGSRNMSDLWQERCATYQEAEEMHKRTVDAVRAGKIPETV